MRHGIYIYDKKRLYFLNILISRIKLNYYMNIFLYLTTIYSTSNFTIEQIAIK